MKATLYEFSRKQKVIVQVHMRLFMLLIGTKSLLFCDVFQYDFLEFNKIVQNKGAPGSESGTGPPLVSPAAGGEKINGTYCTLGSECAFFYPIQWLR